MAQKYVSLENLTTYDGLIKGVVSAGDIATLTSAKSYADGKDTAIAEAKKAGTDAATAAQTADDKAVAAQNDVDALETYVGTFTSADASVNTVVKYVDAKTANIASSDTVTTLTNRVADIEADYLKASDKTALEGEIDAVETAVETEKNRAENVESGLRTDINTVMGDYLKAADKTTLEGKITDAQSTADTAKASIDAFLADADVTATAVDTLKEIQAELDAGETSAASMLAEINALKDVDNATQKELDDAVADINTEIDKKADTTVVTAIDGRVQTLEGKFGTGAGTVSGMISDAIATEGARVDTELAKKIETVKVNGTALTVTDKAVDITVPTDNNQLANGAGYLVASDITGKADKATTLAGYGIADAYTKTEVDTAISNAVAQITPIATSDIENLFN